MEVHDRKKVGPGKGRSEKSVSKRQKGPNKRNYSQLSLFALAALEGLMEGLMEVHPWLEEDIVVDVVAASYWEDVAYYAAVAASA